MEFKACIMPSHSLGPGPHNLSVLCRKVVDEAFVSFLHRYPDDLPQDVLSLSQLIKNWGISGTDRFLADMAIKHALPGDVMAPSFNPLFCDPKTHQQAACDKDEMAILATIDTLRTLVQAMGAFRPRQIRKIPPDGQGRNCSLRVWSVRRQHPLAVNKINAQNYRYLTLGTYPYCRLCDQYCAQYQSQIDGVATRPKSKPIKKYFPFVDGGSMFIYGKSKEYCSLHQCERKERIKAQRVQPVFYGLLAALLYLMKLNKFPRWDLDYTRSFAYEEARERGPYGKCIARKLKTSPDASTKDLARTVGGQLFRADAPQLRIIDKWHQ